MSLVRRTIPFLLLPLSLLACGLASSPWLRAFPSSVLAVPLFGTALLSVLLPVVVIGIGVRKLWLTALIDLIAFVFFAMLVGLQELAGFGDLYAGLVHGPSQILTFALPLISPRTLLIAPLALCWISGAIVGECVGRGWQSVVPYVALLATFGLSYAGSARAITSSDDGRRYDTLFAGALLVTLLLMRAAQAWVEQDTDAESTQPEGILPLRGLAIGALLSIVIALAAAAVVQTSAFSGSPTAPTRVAPVDRSRPLTPVAFIAGLRPDTGVTPQKLFDVMIDRQTTSYLPIAELDNYDGDGWTFDRTFGPSGGVVPADTDPDLRPTSQVVSQQYTIVRGALTSAPWMPYIYRPQRVSGATVNIDPASGMIVPGRPVTPGLRYTVRSTPTQATFDSLKPDASFLAAAPPADLIVPAAAGTPMKALITTLQSELRVAPTDRIAFLQAVARTLRTQYGLSGDAGATRSASPSSAPAHTSSRPVRRSSAKVTGTPGRGASSTRVRASATTAEPSISATPTPSSTEQAPGGATSFATVLGSIQTKKSASPEQYSTFMALVARQIGVPARLVTGFRVNSDRNSPTMVAGLHQVHDSDAYTWVEIPVRGQGWVVLDPSPLHSGKRPAERSSGATAAPSSGVTPTPAQSALVSGANDERKVAKPSKIPANPRPSAVSVLIVGIVVVAALILLVGLFLILRKRLRVRRRRRSGDPRRRLLGAWQESLDVLVESGLPDLTCLTSAEVAKTIHEQFGGEPAAQARYLGDSANAAIFSPASWVGPQQADAAWRAQVVLRRTIRRRLSVRERMNASLRYHRTTRPRPLVGPSSWAAAARARAVTPPVRGRHGTSNRARRRRAH